MKTLLTKVVVFIEDLPSNLVPYNLVRYIKCTSMNTSYIGQCLQKRLFELTRKNADDKLLVKSRLLKMPINNGGHLSAAK